MISFAQIHLLSTSYQQWTHRPSFFSWSPQGGELRLLTNLCFHIWYRVGFPISVILLNLFPSKSWKLQLGPTLVPVLELGSNDSYFNFLKWASSSRLYYCLLKRRKPKTCLVILWHINIFCAGYIAQITRILFFN